MKFKAILVAALCATFSLQSFAVVPTDATTKKNIQEQVSEILQDIEWEADSGTEIEARVCFNVTQDGTVRLIRVSAPISSIERLITKELHDTQLDEISLKEDSDYFWMSVVFKAE
jgi:hypothetical protein